ncbi:hypothetical protein HYV86_07695 [Candidatus Woesearchaeota archaeon]|nr:hypothetical protein [Candidatus Woesearchaeota archaeon]
MDLPHLYQTQISLTDWFEQIKHSKAQKLRVEDNEKRERLRVLNELIGLPFDKPYQFSALDIDQNSLAFQKFVAEHGTELCALRLMPTDPALPKLRTRGQTISNSISWFNQQQIDPTKYRADFVPHPETSLWSTIFIVNSKGIFGEIVKGGHHQLTQGFHDSQQPIVFSYDLKQLKLSQPDLDAQHQIEEILRLISVNDEVTRKKITHTLNAKFFEDYLQGYFETSTSNEFGTWFIDYNTTLAEMYNLFMPVITSSRSSSLLQGQSAHVGVVQGKAKVIHSHTDNKNLEKGDILVCPMTTPAHVMLMQQSVGIITDQGGILSHAAIVARELGKPCVVGTKNATTLLQDGDLIELDATNGVVRRL